jgi:glutamate synthase domain-containing protein 2
MKNSWGRVKKRPVAPDVTEVNTMRYGFLIGAFLLNGMILLGGVFIPGVLYGFLLSVPLTAIGIYDMYQDQHTIMRNFPLVGRFRWWAEGLRPKIYQYFVESNTEGKPIPRNLRSVVYQRAKKELDTNPFGTQRDTGKEGYEWMSHSLDTGDPQDCPSCLRTEVGSSQCDQPYDASIFNISAMSYGSLSSKAVEALNLGARMDDFYHNTGEGGLSPYHEQGGDLVWQIGTAYFGCRTNEGDFCPDTFQENATKDTVKMIEIKLSQGAKPGHGGVLPAKKNTEEIADIRHVEPHTDVISPPSHPEFDTPIGLLEFVERLRELSGGKPVGFKLCIGDPSEFVSIAKAIKETGIIPDFITIDGGEGGTGAAPLEYSNAVGTPFQDGLAFGVDILRGFDLKDEIAVITSGKILTGFHIIKAFALGADLTNSARGMMLALGCIQALECNENTCPTGITTQDPELMSGLVVEDKSERVANYHDETVHATAELLTAAGLEHPDEVGRYRINRRVTPDTIKRYDEIYPPVEKGSLINGSVPERFQGLMERASAKQF